MTVLFSQNGWVASADKSVIHVKNFQVPGANRHFSCAETAAPILINFAAEYHKLVELIDVGTYDDWGYNFAVIPNQKDYSNHASGTALDINATKHQWKAATSGFTPEKETIIDGLCTKYGIRWGWRYKYGFKDPMHFEIVETPATTVLRIKKMQLPMPKES